MAQLNNNPMPFSPTITTTTPDPSVATEARIERAALALKDYIDGKEKYLDERLRGIDSATIVLEKTVNRVPTETQISIGRLSDLTDEQLRSVQTQFRERDTRQERESRDNKVAVDAAFAAQKEAAAKQEETFMKQIDKSELAIKETIGKIQDGIATQFTSLNDKIDDNKARVGAIEAMKLGAVEQKSSNLDLRSLVFGIIGAVGVGTSLLLAFFK